MLRLRKDITVKYRKNENISEQQKVIASHEDIINVPFHVFGQHEENEKK